MRACRKRVALGRMMATIGVIALSCNPIRAESAVSAGIAIVAACVWYLAYRKFADAMAQRVAEGSPTSAPDKDGLPAPGASRPI